MRNIFAALLLALVAVPTSHAQSVVRTPRAGTSYTVSTMDDRDRAMLGIATSTGGRRDTLGLMISSVTAAGPAEKAGLEEGNRILSINGVSLKLSRDDADDEDMPAINQNRLTRVMRTVKAGDDVTLEVWGGGRVRTVKVKTVSANDLTPLRAMTTTRDTDRAALGLLLNPTGSKRDTAGVFVTRVVDGGPAEKAGITEGDRIASINGVDVRVPREDAGDWSVGSSRIDRMEREVRKLKPGQIADLVVISGGRSRTVKVKAVKAADLPGGETSGFRFGTGDTGGMGMIGPGTNGSVRIIRPDGAMNFDTNVHVMPRIRINRGGMEDDFSYELEEGLGKLREIGPQIRRQIEDGMKSRVTVRSVNRVIL